jgi:hypothetical protein
MEDIMDKLNDQVVRYHEELQKGYLQNAYRGIMEFMSGVRAYLSERHPDMTAGALYQGLMDMTFFTITPETLKARKLKVAIVYLHAKNSFEVWLSGANRQVQSDLLKTLKDSELAGYELTEAAPGVDSIISWTITEYPDFNDTEALQMMLEVETTKFIADMVELVSYAGKK